jgi:hypothetical protein
LSKTFLPIFLTAVFACRTETTEQDGALLAAAQAALNAQAPSTEFEIDVDRS